jgi:hypothetical protein
VLLKYGILDDETSKISHEVAWWNGDTKIGPVPLEVITSVSFKRCSFHICGRLATQHGKSLVLNLSGAQGLLGCVLADFEMLQIKMGLPNGRSEKITVPLSSKVGDLKLLALDLLARGFLRIVTAEGRPLVAEETLEAGVQEGDYLTFIAVQRKERR